MQTPSHRRRRRHSRGPETKVISTAIEQGQEKKVRIGKPGADKTGWKRSSPCANRGQLGTESRRRDHEPGRFADLVPRTMLVGCELQACLPGVAVLAAFKRKSRTLLALRDSSLI